MCWNTPVNWVPLAEHSNVYYRRPKHLVCFQNRSERTVTWGHVNSLSGSRVSLSRQQAAWGQTPVFAFQQYPPRGSFLADTADTTEAWAAFQGRSYHPSLSAALTLTPNCTRNFTISVWPAHTALCRAVMPSSLGRLGSSTYNVNQKGGRHSHFLSL